MLGAENMRKTVPAVSIIIDDLGEQFEAGQRALKLPGQVAYAFLPGTPFVAQQARAVHRGGREVLLHLPMEHPGGKLYPLGLSQKAPQEELRRRFAAALKSVPHASGVNNHQGSLLTERRDPMIWLMQEIRAVGGLYFVDSRTSTQSVAYEIARQMGVSSARREVFLDAVRAPAAIARAWQLTLLIAQKRGAALAIAHPYPETLAMLETELPKLKGAGVRLIPPSELIQLRGNDRPRALRLKPILTLARRTTNRAGPAPTIAVAAGAKASRP
ncbi:MAG: divergent polysaccharide deacetylase family protein [Pseudomonadota bacterium]